MPFCDPSSSWESEAGVQSRQGVLCYGRSGGGVGIQWLLVGRRGWPSVEPEEGGVRVPEAGLHILEWAKSCVPTLERLSVPETVQDSHSPAIA